jgi:hypothetical protein
MLDSLGLTSGTSDNHDYDDDQRQTQLDVDPLSRGSEEALLRSAVESYATGFRGNPGHYHAGINALTLMHLYRHLSSETCYEVDMTIRAGLFVLRPRTNRPKASGSGRGRRRASWRC